MRPSWRFNPPSRCFPGSIGFLKIPYALKLGQTSEFGIARSQFTNRSKKESLLKKKSRIQIAREIIAQVKRGMQLPRLTDPVRNSFFAQADPARNSRQPILIERAVRAFNPSHSRSIERE
jgi:hypothetical protein